MRVCKNCNSIFDNDYPRCALCGAETEPVTVVSQSENNPNTSNCDSTSNCTNTPIGIPRVARVMSYIGLGMSIFGLVLGGIALLGSFSSFSIPEFGIVFMIYAVMALGGSIAGMNLTSKAMYEGLYSSACTTGKTLSIVGLAINIAACVISFLGTLG